MPRLSLTTRKLRQRRRLVAVLLSWLEILDVANFFLFIVCCMVRYHMEKYSMKKVYSMFEHIPTRRIHIHSLTQDSDRKCIDHLRMDRYTFAKLCLMLRTRGGLTDSKYVSLEKQVALFLNILAHHTKNRIVQEDFKRSGWTISEYFNRVLRSVLRLQSVLLKSPEPIRENCSDERWKWFQNCIGALDGTHIKVRVPEQDKPRYRNRKGEISTNILAACSRDMQFIYVLPGWEGSAADGRVLRDAVARPDGLRVPRGCCCDVSALARI